MIALRDKKVPKYLLIVGSIFTVFDIALLWINFSFGYNIAKWIVLFLLLFLDGYSIYVFLLPEIAIEGTEEGIYISYLRKKFFYSFAEIEYASYKERNSAYARSDNAWMFCHNKNNDIGTVYISIKTQSNQKIISLYGIIQASFIAHWITDEKKKERNI